MTSFQILLLQFCINFFSFSSRDSSVGSPVGARVFFFGTTFGPALGPTQVSTQWIWEVKHSGREVYHSSPPSAEGMNEWTCIPTSPCAFMGQGLFSLLSHARYMPRPSRRCNEVVRQCEAPVIQISACCYLPGPNIQPPHHSVLQHPQSASPAHHASFVYRDNNGGHF